MSYVFKRATRQSIHGKQKKKRLNTYKIYKNYSYTLYCSA